jgi:hypothetical protein
MFLRYTARSILLQAQQYYATSIPDHEGSDEDYVIVACGRVTNITLMIHL